MTLSSVYLYWSFLSFIEYIMGMDNKVKRQKSAFNGRSNLTNIK